MRTFIHIIGAALLGLVAAKSVGYALDYYDSRPRLAGIDLPHDAERVVVLVRDTCPHCKRLTRWLDKHDVRYTTYEVTKSATGVRLFAEIDETAVPVTLVDGYRVVGFKPDVIGPLVGIDEPPGR